MIGSPNDSVAIVIGRTSTEEVVLRSRGRRLLRGIAASVGFVVPVVLLAFAVRQQFDPLIAADKASITASTRFTRAHELAPALIALQEATQPLVLYAACTLAVAGLGLR